MNLGHRKPVISWSSKRKTRATDQASEGGQCQKEAGEGDVLHINW